MKRTPMTSRTMLRSAQLLALLLVVMAAAPAFADRRTGLAGNRLFQDADDSFMYPQLVVDYKNLARFDYGANSGSGNALAILRVGDDAAVGIGIHRGDVLSPQAMGATTEIAWLNNPTLPLVGAQGMNLPFEDGGLGQLNVLDVMFGTKLGGGSFGLRLSFGNNKSVTELDASDAQTTGSKTGFVGLTAGYSMRGDLVLDSSLNITYASGSSAAAGDTTLESSLISVGLSNRGFYKMTDLVDLGFIADLAFVTQSTTNVAANPDDTISGSTFGLVLGAGPAHQINSDTRFGLYGVLGFSRTGVDPSDQAEDDNFSQTTFLIPGLRMAFETALTRWLFVRSGVQYNWQTISTNQEIAGSDNALTSGRNSDFTWNAGLGLRFGSFSFDAALNHDWLVRGPNFLSGAQGNMFLIASASYQW